MTAAALGQGQQAINLDLKPRPHGQEAVDAGLNTEVLSRLDIAMQQAILNKEVAGLIALIHRNGQRGYFEAFGFQDIEAGKAMPKDAIFRLMSMTKPIIAVAALTLYDAGRFGLDDPIANHCPEWAAPQVLEPQGIAWSRLDMAQQEDGVNG